MKTAEEQAVDYAHNRFGDDQQKIFVAASSFSAGHAAGLAEVKIIWRKPSERPTMHKIKEKGSLAYSNIVTVSKGWVSSERYYYYPSGPTSLGYASHWTYLSDFLKLLPDWATSEVGE